MNKNNKIPTARLCDILSLVLAALGLGAALVFFLSKPITASSATLSLLLMIGSFAIGVMVRILGIIGQILYDLKGRMDLREEAWDKNIQLVRDDMSQNTLMLKQVAEQISCDTRDLNDHIRQIRTFFELIEKHLNLKK